MWEITNNINLILLIYPGIYNVYSADELIINDKVIEEWTNKASPGNVVYQSNLGRLYKDLRQYDKALYWWKKAAAQNDARALYGLGVMYMQGLGVERDIKKSVDYKLRSAEAGHISAEYDIVVYYLNGIKPDIDININEGISYLERAARKGYPKARYNLGLIYIYGLPGLPPQEDKNKKAAGLIDSAREKDPSLIWDIFDPKLKW